MNNIIEDLYNLLYLTFIYVIAGIIIGSFIENLCVKIYGKLHSNIEKYNKRSIISLMLEVISQMFIVAIVYFYCKHFLLKIPIINYLSNKINYAKNYDLTIIFTFPFFSFQQNLEDKFIYLLSRMNKYNLKIQNY
jgi:hypothetical protein